MIYRYCWFLFVLIACQERVIVNQTLEISINKINRKELLKKIKEIKFKDQCPENITYSLESNTPVYTIWNFKNVGREDIFLITGNNWGILLTYYGFDKEFKFRGIDDSYKVESPYSNPCIIKLSKGEEFFIYDEDGIENGGNGFIHTINKIKFFNSQDSMFNEVWFRYPELEIFRSPLDYVVENKKYLDESRFLEIYNSITFHDSIVSSSNIIIESESSILNTIRSIH